MLRNALPLVAIALLGTGCAMSGNSGIWMIFVTPYPESNCEELVDHNYSGASVPAGQTQDEWTEEETFTGSDGVVFAQLFGAAGDDQMIMVVGNRTYLGNKDGGQWTFRWESFEDQTETLDHESGYHYSVNQLAEGTEEFIVEIKGNTLTGTWGFSFDQELSFEESDQWDDSEVGQYIGETPSGNYLVDSNDSSVWNTADSAECTGNPCTLAIVENCANATQIEGRQTDYDDDAFYGVSQSGQPFGLEGQ